MKHTPDASFLKKSIGWGMRVIFAALILALVALACALPDFSDFNIRPAKVTVTPLQLETLAQATLTAAAPEAGVQNGTLAPKDWAPGSPEKPAVSLPPALVEVEPIPGSEIGPGTAPVFYFNQAMDRGSVERAFTTQPDLGGRFEWIDDAAVRFIPGLPPGAGTGIRLTIGSGVRAANGMTMAEPAQVNYQAAGPLLLTQRLPAPDAEDVNPSSAVVVAFNRPVVPLGADLQGLAAAFSLDPPAVGRGAWLNTSTYIFYPQPGLMGGIRYTVRLNSSLTSVDGSALESRSSLEWSFSTSLPVLLSVQPGTEQPLPLDAAFKLTFNQPMDAASVEGNFSLLGPAGAVAGTFSWNSASTEMTFLPSELLQREAGYALALFGTASSLGGATIGRDFAASLITVPQFAIMKTRPAAGEILNAASGYGSVELAFSSPVAIGQDFGSLISLDPPVVGQSVYRDFNGYQMFVSGYFLPSTSYTLTVSPALADRWGATLDAPYAITFSSQPAQPSLVVPVLQAGANSLFIPQDEASLPARSTNIERLVLSRGRLSLGDFIAADQDWQGLQNWESKVQTSWPVLLYPTPNVSEEIHIPLALGGERVDPGLYLLKIDTQPELAGQQYSKPVLLVVSPVQIVFKVSARQAFAWVVSVPENTPLPDEEIIFYDSTAAAVASCTTDTMGTCQAALPERSDPYALLYAVLGQPGDQAFSLAASNWQNGVAAWEFGLPYENKGTVPEVYLFTDRPIYRPGQTVNFRAIVLEQDNTRYAPAGRSQVTAEIASPYDAITGQSQMMAEIRMAIDSYGSATGVYTLPEDARPGTYTLRLQEGELQGIGFEVAEYRKPEIDLRVTYQQPASLVGDDLHAEVNANYFFGAPASNLPLRWSLFRSRGAPNISGGFQTGKLDTSWLEPWSIGGAGNVYVMEGQAQTGPDGTAIITLPGQELRDRLDTASGDLHELVLEVTMEDESGLPVSAHDTLQMHPSPYYIGVRPEKWTVQAAQEITYSVRTVDWQGSPAADKLLTAHFVKVKWVQQDVTDPQAPPDYRAEYTEVGSTDFRTSPEGEARLAFIPAEPGTFMLEISGADGDGNNSGAVTQVLTWVGGPGATEWPNLPNQHVLLRSSSDSGESAEKPFQPGETARVFIPNPFQGEALALVTVERGKVMRSQVVEIQNSSYTLELPLTVDDAPNIYVAVTLLGRTNNRADFRVGYLELHVDPKSLVLNVEVETSPSQPQPGEDVTVNIRVKDEDGKPVQGAFSLALIDKAVLALADPNSLPVVQAFYGRQPLGVQSSFSLAEYSGRFLYSPPGRGGGGGGDAQASAPVRSSFADTAYWNGTVVTDVTGTAQLRLTLPDNLTTWHADVRGLDADMRMGQATADLIASKPLLIRPVTPRFAVPGDHLAMEAVVHNNTQDTLEASVRLEGSGFSLDDLNQAVQRVSIPAGERRSVSWWGTVQDVPALDLTFSAESTTAGAGALRDAAKPENSPLPVLSYTGAQTFATTGLLDQAGEKLELVSLPRSFTPTGGELRVELSPSLAAAVLEGLEALEGYPRDFTEPILSRLLPNLATYQALKELNLENATLPGAAPLQGTLEGVMADSVDRLVWQQNENGGWGWAAGYDSDPYISSYVLFGLSRAAQSGVLVDPQVVQRGRDYLSDRLAAADKAQPWEADRLAFQFFALQQAGQADLNITLLYDYRDKLSPWGKAFLALVLEGQTPGDPRARTLLSDLEASATRSATGASWQDLNPTWHNWSTPNFTTAVVVYAIARLNPASPVLADATRFIVLNRRSNGAAGGWNSSYETAWSVMALVEGARGTGNLQASYNYSASLNGSPLAEGKVENPAQAVNPVTSTVPLSGLYTESPNALSIQRGEGSGLLYYRAHLQVNRPAQDAPAIQRGLSITRQYYRSGLDCRQDACLPVDGVDLGDPQPILVRLTLTVPEDMYYVVVEDTFPAGTEVLNPRLKTSQQNIAPAGGASQGSEPDTRPMLYDPQNPFAQGWGGWLFKDPLVYDDHIRWVVDALPAGTYELTYRLTPFLAGEFRVIPAHAWSYYFPEVEGTSKGSVLYIQ